MSQIYRYKFTDQLLEELKSFASVHRYDEIPIFREHWETWLTKNKEIVMREERVLKRVSLFPIIPSVSWSFFFE